MTAISKRVNVFFVVAMIIQFSYSQSPVGIIPMDTKVSTVLDSANYLFTYKMNFITDSSKPQSISSNDCALLVGNRYSKFFNAHYLKNPTIEVTQGGRHNIGHTIDGKGLAGTEIFKNLSEKTMMVTTIVFGSNNVYSYKEKIPEIEWKLENEEKSIQGYVCQKATTTFLGRSYIAWFAQEIPISNGPWKLGGLPGLILQVSDTQNHYLFECTGIQTLTKKLPILQYDVKYGETNRTSLNNLIKRMHLNFEQYITLQGRTLVKGSMENISLPYNPIERE
jgi:GLPGLI family protein